MKADRIVIVSFALLLSLAPQASARSGSSGEAERMAVLEASEEDFHAGLAAHRMGDLPAAERAYRAAVEKDPRYFEARVNLARVLAEGARLDEAAEHANEVLREQRGWAAAWTVLGLVELRRGRLPEAADALHRARRLAPGDVETLTNLGAALTGQGFAVAAIGVLEEALERDPDNAGAAFNLAYACDLAGRRSHAAYYYRHFLELAPLHDDQRAPVLERLAELEGVLRGQPAPPPLADAPRPAPSPDAGAPPLAGSQRRLPDVAGPQPAPSR